MKFSNLLTNFFVGRFDFSVFRSPSLSKPRHTYLPIFIWDRINFESPLAQRMFTCDRINFELPLAQRINVPPPGFKHMTTSHLKIKVTMMSLYYIAVNRIDYLIIKILNLCLKIITNVVVVGLYFTQVLES